MCAQTRSSSGRVNTTVRYSSIYFGGEKERYIVTMATLFDRLGGVDIVTAAVEEMYARLLADASTARFFEHTSMIRLKLHLVQFLKVAFGTTLTATTTTASDDAGAVAPIHDFDVAAMLREKHHKLFATMGLNETHFDTVFQHFVGAFYHVGAAPALIDEAAAVLLSLRSVFEDGAREWGSTNKAM